MEYYSAIKKKEAIIRTNLDITGMNLENIMLSERKKPDIKDHILYDSIYMKFQNMQVHRNRKYINGCLGSGVEGGTGEKHQKDDP